jgi:integrase
MVGSAASKSPTNPVDYRVGMKWRLHMPQLSSCRKPSRRRVPSYRLHKPSGQAVVTLDGKDFYLGVYRSSESRTEYARRIAEWEAGGRSLPAPGSDVTIAELVLRYWKYAKGYYVKDGRRTSEVSEVRYSMRPLRKLYGETLARDFGPLALKAVREKMIEAGLCRGTINKRVDRIKRMVRWAVAEELIPPSVYHGLQAVPGLPKGRSPAPDHAPVEPVAEALIQSTLHHLRPVVADMVRLQRLTGMRPAEVCLLRPCDLDRTGDVWVYRPASHKTEHFGRKRSIPIGPKGQEILRPYLLRSADAYCFCPRDSEAAHNCERRANRQSKVTPSQARRRPKRNPKRPPGECYSTVTYGGAIARACRLAGVPVWYPNRLRHSAATEIRKQYGLEAAQTVLGHSNMDVTQIYAEKNLTLAAEIMRKIG